MDFEETTIKVVKQEFIAIVLAGFGAEYVTFACNASPQSSDSNSRTGTG